MDENQKKIGLIALIVIAVGAVAFMAVQAGSGDRMQVVGEVVEAPPGHKSEKERALEAQQAAAAQGMAAPPVDRGDDLGSVGAGTVGGGGKR